MSWLYVFTSAGSGAGSEVLQSLDSRPQTWSHWEIRIGCLVCLEYTNWPRSCSSLDKFFSFLKFHYLILPWCGSTFPRFFSGPDGGRRGILSGFLLVGLPVDSPIWTSCDASPILSSPVCSATGVTWRCFAWSGAGAAVSWLSGVCVRALVFWTGSLLWWFYPHVSCFFPFGSSFPDGILSICYC